METLQASPNAFEILITTDGKTERTIKNGYTFKAAVRIAKVMATIAHSKSHGQTTLISIYNGYSELVYQGHLYGEQAEVFNHIIER